MSDEGEIEKARKQKEAMKHVVGYLKFAIEESDKKMARNFAKGSFALATADARETLRLLEVLGGLDLQGS